MIKKMEEYTNHAVKASVVSPSRKRITPQFDAGVVVAESIPIAPTLKALQIGGIAKFPTEQRTSLLATIYRMRKDYARQGWDVEIVDDGKSDNDFTIKVKRIR